MTNVDILLYRDFRVTADKKDVLLLLLVVVVVVVIATVVIVVARTFTNRVFSKEPPNQ